MANPVSPPHLSKMIQAHRFLPISDERSVEPVLLQPEEAPMAGRGCIPPANREKDAKEESVKGEEETVTLSFATGMVMAMTRSTAMADHPERNKATLLLAQSHLLIKCEEE